MAAKQEIRAYPTRTNQIPRHIPPPHWASHPAILYLAAGLLPFGTIFVELYFAMTSIWQVRATAGADSPHSRKTRCSEKTGRQYLRCRAKASAIDCLWQQLLPAWRKQAERK